MSRNVKENELLLTKRRILRSDFSIILLRYLQLPYGSNGCSTTSFFNRSINIAWYQLKERICSRTAMVALYERSEVLVADDAFRTVRNFSEWDLAGLNCIRMMCWVEWLYRRSRILVEVRGDLATNFLHWRINFAKYQRLYDINFRSWWLWSPTKTMLSLVCLLV